MSISVFLVGASWSIDASDADDALEVLTNAYSELEDASDLEEALSELGIYVQMDAEGGVADLLEAEGEADYRVMRLLGPFVTRGSYVHTEYEGHASVYVFTGRHCHECSLADLQRQANTTKDVFEALQEDDLDLSFLDELDDDDEDDEDDESLDDSYDDDSFSGDESYEGDDSYDDEDDEEDDEEDEEDED